MIEFNPRTQGFEVTCKFFTDDLEQVISNMHGAKMVLGTGEIAAVDELIDKHLNEHFKLRFDDQPIVMRFVGKEVEADMTFCYLEFFRNSEFHVVKIENTCLMEEFPDQQNIVDLKVNGTTSTVVLSQAKKSDVIYR